MLESLLRDLRYSARMLLAQPGFALAAILTLALGIGANTAVFSVIEGRLLRPLPYPEAGRLVHIHNAYPGMGVLDAGVTVPDYLDRREHAPALADSAIWYDYSFDLAGHGAPQRIPGVAASPSLFSTLGVGAQLGRTFLESEAQAGNERVVLLSDALWRNLFAADASIVGRDVRISGQAYRVVGVMPATFSFPRREVGLWVPFAYTPKQMSDAMRGFEFARSSGGLRLARRSNSSMHSSMRSWRAIWNGWAARARWAGRISASGWNAPVSPGARAACANTWSARSGRACGCCRRPSGWCC